MVVAFLAGLVTAGDTGAVDLEISRNIFKDLTSDFIEHFELIFPNLLKLAKPYQENPYIKSASLPEKEIDAQNSLNIARLLNNFLKLGLSDELEGICAKLVLNARSSNMKTEGAILFDSLYIPLLKDLAAMIGGNELRQHSSLFFRGY
jgi:hypothetical protein